MLVDHHASQSKDCISESDFSNIQSASDNQSNFEHHALGKDKSPGLVAERASITAQIVQIERKIESILWAKTDLSSNKITYKGTLVNRPKT